MSSTYWHIRNCQLFQKLNPEEIQQLEANSRYRKAKKNEPIYLPADQADGVVLLVTGRVRICHITPEGKQSILVFIEPGEIFGELALVGAQKREEFAEAAEKSDLVLIPRMAIEKLMVTHPDLTLGISKIIGLRRQRVERRLKYLLFRSNRERLIHLILELVEQYGEKKGNTIDIGIKLSHQELANIIGSTRETVTVVLGQLQNEGLLTLSRRKIIVTQLDRLVNEVNSKRSSDDTKPESQAEVAN